MKNKLFLILTLLLAGKLWGQDPEFAYDFVHNRALINPAYSGKVTYMTFNLVMNRQWLFPQAPQHGTFWFSTRFRKMGFGTQISMSNTAQFYKVMMGLDYFYDITLSGALHLSMGLSAALLQDFFNLSEVVTIQPDPLLQDQKAFSRFYPQMATGAMLYNQSFEFGVSATRLLPYSGYMFLDKKSILPPVFIVHGAYFYKHPIDLYSFSLDGAAFVSKQSLFVRPNFVFYTRGIIKLGAGLSGKLVYAQDVFRINMHYLLGLKLANKFYFTYELTVYSINYPVPALAKIGNSLSIRFDFYPYQKDIPRFY